MGQPNVFCQNFVFVSLAYKTNFWIFERLLLSLANSTNLELDLKTSVKMSLSRTITLSKSLVFKQSLKPLSTSTILRLSEDATKKPDDLIVDYLDGNRSGIVVFGLNRPVAKNSFSKNLVLQLIG